ncbi:hypothetical protein ACVDFE_02020 [Lentzea chajnantorensis]
MTADLTVAALLQREGVQWPAVSTSRHALHETSDLQAFWADGLTPRQYVPSVAEDSRDR